MPFFDPVFKYVLVLCFGAMSVGFVLAYFSPAKESLETDFGFSSFQLSAFNAIPPISAIIGSPLINVLVKRFGRKIPTIIVQAGIVVGWILVIATQKSYFWLSFIGRVISGISIGGISGIVPIYINELAPEDSKNAYGVLNQLFVSIGTVFCYTFGFTKHWRYIASLSLIPCVIFFIFIWFCPESPLVNQLKNEQQGNQSKESIFQKKFIIPMLTAAFAVIFQQFSGINALLTNLQPIFRDSNIPLSPTVASIIVGAAQVVATASASFITSYFGNKVCWIISAAGQALFLMLAWANEQFSLSTTIPVICLFFDVLMFGVGLGPIPWYVVVLVFPPDLCSLASSLTQGFNYILCSITMFTFDPMVQSMKIGWVYFFYSIVMIFGVIYGAILVPSGKDEKSEDSSNQAIQREPLIE